MHAKIEKGVQGPFKYDEQNFREKGMPKALMKGLEVKKYNELKRLGLGILSRNFL